MQLQGCVAGESGQVLDRKQASFYADACIRQVLLKEQDIGKQLISSPVPIRKVEVKSVDGRAQIRHARRAGMIPDPAVLL